MAVRLIPLLDRILVSKSKLENKSLGGIILPEGTSNKFNEAVVVAVGPGARSKDGQYIPPGVKTGDKVLLSDYGGSDIKLDGKEYSLYREEDILGILKDK